MAGLFWKKKCTGFEEVQRVLVLEWNGKVIPRRGVKDRKGVGTSRGKSGTRNLEAESIRSRVESTDRG